MLTEAQRARKRKRYRDRYADPANREQRNKQLRERRAKDPAFRERENTRNSERKNERYATDPIYQTRVQKRNRERNRDRRATDPAYRERQKKWERERNAANPGAKHGLAAVDLAEMRGFQDGLCPLCNSPLSGRIVIDHDHAHCPGAKGCHECIRFLAHHTCNTAFGLFGDTPAALRRAADRIERVDRRKRLWLDVVPTESRPRRKRAAP